MNLFFTPYDSFVDGGNAKVYPIVKIGAFYITGYGRWQGNRFQGNAPDDPCIGGNVGDPLDGLPAGQGTNRQRTCEPVAAGAPGWSSGDTS